MNTRIFTAIFFLLFVFMSSIQVASAAVEDKLKGWAWSDNIGWISFNCFNTDTCDDVDYGVTADSGGNLSGYAWSNHAGWLSFAYYGNATINATTGVISGDAHFIGADAEEDGWEGKVSLSGTSPTYGLSLNTSTFEINGHAWGDTIVGWIDFKTPYSAVTYDPFYFAFTANAGTENNKVVYNGSVILTWVTEGADSCTATNGNSQWTSGNPRAAGEPSPGVETITNLTADTTFSLRCSDSSNNTITRDLTILVNPPAPSVVIGADDTNIGYNTATNLNWTAVNVSSCTASGDWSGSKPVGTNSESTGNLVGTPTNPHNFDIECVSAYPATYPDNVSDNIYIDVEKLTVQFYPEQETVAYNDAIKLYYQTEFPTGCTPGFVNGTIAVPGWTSHTVNLTEGEHVFETAAPITEEDGAAYTATLTCTGSGGQSPITRTINLNARKNPNYQEV